MRLFLALLAIPVLIFGSLAFLAIADADQGSLTPDESVNATRPCEYAGATTQVVAVSSTTAKTSTLTGKGKVRVLCSARAFMFQSAFGVTGATATTGDIPIPANVPEFLWSRGSVFAFIRDTADGSCAVTQCK